MLVIVAHTRQFQLVCVGNLDNFIGQSMQRFRGILLVISAMFLIASCGSSTASTAAAAIEGIPLAAEVKVL
jgi:hypothetical protein